jgi:hypothetical protein
MTPIPYFWRINLLLALLVGCWVAFAMPAVWFSYGVGLAVGGAHWLTVAWRTRLLGQVTQHGGVPHTMGVWIKVFSVLATMLVAVAFARPLATAALKHWIVFVGLFIYNVGMVVGVVVNCTLFSSHHRTADSHKRLW